MTRSRWNLAALAAVAFGALMLGGCAYHHHGHSGGRDYGYRAHRHHHHTHWHHGHHGRPRGHGGHGHHR